MTINTNGFDIGREQHPGFCSMQQRPWMCGAWFKMFSISRLGEVCRMTYERTASGAICVVEVGYDSLGAQTVDDMANIMNVHSEPLKNVAVYF